jgi:heme oxygenase
MSRNVELLQNHLGREGLDRMTIVEDGDQADTMAAERFSEVVKSASWEVHERAERSPFMRRLLAGEGVVSEYAAMVAQHFFVYSVIEEAAERWRADPVVSQFAAPELTRRPSLERDLRALLGDEWATRIEPNDGTRQYVARLREVCFDWAGGFVAHHYVRYLGDLSGGQIIRRILARTYGLGHDDGTSFYHFEAVDPVPFKKRYRMLLDTAPWAAAERGRVVAEVIRAFELNTAVLDDLGA